MHLFYFRKNIHNGFTLIELLFVVAIISLLSSVVLVNLGVAKNRAKNSSIQANLNTVRSEVELYYVNNGNIYGVSITSSSDCNVGLYSSVVISNAIAEAVTDAGANKLCAVGVNGQTWAVSIPLSSGGNWCVDTSGFGGLGVATGGGLAPATCTPEI